MNHHHTSSLMSVTMMMSTTSSSHNSTSHMSSTNSFDKAFLLSDMELAEHLEDGAQQVHAADDAAAVLQFRSKALSSSVSSSLFARMIEEMECNKSGNNSKEEETKDDEDNSERTSSAKSGGSSSSNPNERSLLSSSAITSFEDLPEHDFDSDLMGVMNSFQKHMSVSSHVDEDGVEGFALSSSSFLLRGSNSKDEEDEEVDNDGEVRFQINPIIENDCNPLPLPEKGDSTKTKKSKSSSKSSSVKKHPKKVNDMVPFPIPSFKKKNDEKPKKEKKEEVKKNIKVIHIDDDEDEDAAVKSPTSWKPCQSSSSNMMSSPNMALACSIKHIAPALVTPNNNDTDASPSTYCCPGNANGSNSSSSRRSITKPNVDDAPPVPAFAPEDDPDQDDNDNAYQQPSHHHYTNGNGYEHGDGSNYYYGYGPTNPSCYSSRSYDAAPALTVSTATSSSLEATTQLQWHDSLSTQGDEDAAWGTMRPLGANMHYLQHPQAVHNNNNNSFCSNGSSSSSLMAGSPPYPQEDYYYRQHQQQHHHHHSDLQQYHHADHHAPPPPPPPLPVLTRTTTNDQHCSHQGYSLETEYMMAAERLQQSMQRSKMTRSAVTRGPSPPRTTITCASANSGALLRDHHCKQQQQQQQPPPQAAAAAGGTTASPTAAFSGPASAGGFFSHV